MSCVYPDSVTTSAAVGLGARSKSSGSPLTQPGTTRILVTTDSAARFTRRTCGNPSLRADSHGLPLAADRAGMTQAGPYRAASTPLLNCELAVAFLTGKSLESEVTLGSSSHTR